MIVLWFYKLWYIN